MNYSTQDTVSPYREKVTLELLPVCLRALPAKVHSERPPKEKEKQNKEKKQTKRTIIIICKPAPTHPTKRKDRHRVISERRKPENPSTVVVRFQSHIKVSY